MSAAEVNEAVLLLGGLGTRLRPVISDRPKPLAVVAGRPFVEWLLLQLRQAGIRRVVLSIGYKAEMFVAHFGANAWHGLELVYAPESEPLGTGGALRLALETLAGPEILALNGDSFCRFNLQRLAAAHRAAKAQATLWLASVDDSARFGLVDVDPGGTVKGFHEKNGQAKPGCINAGVYLFQHDCLAALPRRQRLSVERELFPQLASAGRLHAVVGDGTFLDIGTPETYGTSEATLEAELKWLESTLPVTLGTP